ncbi:MAG: nucleotidyltransferase domain-containing protein [Prevotellaceae bacterium]|jgi:predicted nucleotidyltransferase|nr:nucleotidyltransferase domain-containing protein [Prevotellaceae bacterium]
MREIIEKNIDELKELCVLHNVAMLFVFGSVLTRKFNKNSDVDFLVSFKKMDFGDYTDNYFELADKFEKLLNRKVDLVTDKSLKNPYFIESVNNNKLQIYG